MNVVLMGVVWGMPSVMEVIFKKLEPMNPVWNILTTWLPDKALPA